VEATKRFKSDYGTALDLGCGAGTEALEMLTQGWSVLAIDREPEAIDRLLQKVPRKHKGRLQTRVSPFEGLTLPPADFIYASLSLPFCHPDHFLALWSQIESSLRPGGLFVGQLFGPRDSWASNPGMTFHSREAVTELLKPFDIEILDEVEEDGRSVIGQKHWHVFHITATKKL
jgi:SAM-dependent methyltransferase